jgi:hypothetical protein
VGYYVIFKKPTQSKQLPNGRKFAQSGHPDARVTGLGKFSSVGWLFSLGSFCENYRSGRNHWANFSVGTAM